MSVNRFDVVVVVVEMKYYNHNFVHQNLLDFVVH